MWHVRAFEMSPKSLDLFQSKLALECIQRMDDGIVAEQQTQRT